MRRKGYGPDMTTTTEAIMRGARRGMAMGAHPDPTRLRELAAEARSTDYTAEAWREVGETLRWATTQASPSRTSSSR